MRFTTSSSGTCSKRESARRKRRRRGQAGMPVLLTGLAATTHFRVSFAFRETLDSPSAQFGNFGAHLGVHGRPKVRPRNRTEAAACCGMHPLRSRFVLYRDDQRSMRPGNRRQALHGCHWQRAEPSRLGDLPRLPSNRAQRQNALRTMRRPRMALRPQPQVLGPFFSRPAENKPLRELKRIRIRTNQGKTNGCVDSSMQVKAELLP